MESSHTSWFILMVNETGIVLKIHAAVQCSASGQAVAASVARPTHARRNQRIAELAEALVSSKA
jgi:ribulose kinase